MNARPTVWLLSALLAALATSDALACGETLFRTGSSMRQHMQATQAPARILVLAEASGGEQAERESLYAGLRRAGHSVDEVADSTALAEALEAGSYDLVLAHQSEVPAVVATLDSDSATRQASDVRRPTLIPVLAKGQRSLEPFTVCVKQGAEVRTFLRAIARAMREGAP